MIRKWRQGKLIRRMNESYWLAIELFIFQRILWENATAEFRAAILHTNTTKVFLWSGRISQGGYISFISNELQSIWGKTSGEIILTHN